MDKIKRRYTQKVKNVNFNKIKTYEEVVEPINAYIYKYNYLRPQ